MCWFAQCVGSLVVVTVVLEEALHKRKAEPLSEFLACFRQSSDGNESKRLMESNGGYIDSANTGNDAVTAPRLTEGNQFSQKLRPYSVTFTICAHVDGILNRKTVTFARRNGEA